MDKVLVPRHPSEEKPGPLRKAAQGCPGYILQLDQRPLKEEKKPNILMWKSQILN